MATTAVSTPASKSFLHSADPSGLLLSICPVCFRTIASANEATDLNRDERTHICTSDDLSLQAKYGLD